VFHKSKCSGYLCRPYFSSSGNEVKRFPEISVMQEVAGCLIFFRINVLRYEDVTPCVDILNPYPREILSSDMSH
jgi:hypothetical protein